MCLKYSACPTNLQAPPPASLLFHRSPCRWNDSLTNKMASNFLRLPSEPVDMIASNLAPIPRALLLQALGWHRINQYVSRKNKNFAYIWDCISKTDLWIRRVLEIKVPGQLEAQFRMPSYHSRDESIVINTQINNNRGSKI